VGRAKLRDQCRKGPTQLPKGHKPALPVEQVRTKVAGASRHRDCRKLGDEAEIVADELMELNLMRCQCAEKSFLLLNGKHSTLNCPGC